MVSATTAEANTPNGLDEFSYVLPNEERVVFCTSKQYMIDQIASSTLHTFIRGQDWAQSLADALTEDLPFTVPIANAPADFVIPVNNPGYTTTFSVVEGDCLEAAEALLAQGLNPAVLNMASDHTPGGGYKGGAGAQEENLFRRSNLARVLANEGKWFNPNNPVRPPNKFYPLPDPSVVYSPSAYVMRASEAKGYAWLEKPYQIAFLGSAAYRRPSLTKDNLHLLPKFAEGFLEKVRALLWTSARYGHDAVVLSAWGCGAFLNPPEHIAQLFQQVLQEKWIQGRFKNVTFAIFDDHNAYRDHNPDGNVRPFIRTFLPKDHPDYVAASAPRNQAPNPRSSAAKRQAKDKKAPSPAPSVSAATSSSAPSSS